MANNPQFTAYDLMETPNIGENYPLIYKAAVQRFSGKIKSTLKDKIKGMKYQKDNNLLPNYLPKDLYDKLQVILF